MNYKKAQEFLFPFLNLLDLNQMMGQRSSVVTHWLLVPGYHGSNPRGEENHFFFCFWDLISWLQLTLELIHDYSKWFLIHELIQHIWLWVESNYWREVFILWAGRRYWSGRWKPTCSKEGALLQRRAMLSHRLVMWLSRLGELFLQTLKVKSFFEC